MKILLTGATGFIGSNLFLKLRRHKYEVIGLALKQAKIADQKILALDLKNKRKVQDFFTNHKIDTVIHLAAAVPAKFTNNIEEKRIFDDNLLSTSNLLDAFGRSRAGLFIYASSISVIGQPCFFSVDETHPLNPNNFYSLSKLFGEMLGRQYALATGKTFIGFRITAPYGPGQRLKTVINIFLENALKSKNLEVFGQGKRAQDFIYIDDLADAFLLALKSKRSDIFNIGSGQSVSSSGLAKKVLANCPESRSKTIFKGTDSQEGYQLKVNIEKAKKILKFKPKYDIDAGIREYIKYLVKK
jgi:nucleoside-diphosphate-sugar epimerase